MLNKSRHDVMRKILEKDPAERSQEELKTLVSAVEDIKFFSNLPIKGQDLIDLMQTFTFEAVSAGDNVFEYGDFGSTFYVIIKGTCSVLIRNP